MWMKISEILKKILKKKPFWVISSLLLILCLFIRNSFFGFLIECSISQRYPDTKINFSKICLRESALVIEGLKIISPNVNLETKEIKLGLNLDLSHLKISPKVEIIKPLIVTKETKGNPLKITEIKPERIFKLLSNRVCCDIQEGVWQHQQLEQFRFSLVSDKDCPQLKKLMVQVFSNQQHSLIDLSIRPYNHELFFSIDLKSFDANIFNQIDFVSTCLKKYGMEKFQGLASGQANFRLGRKLQLLKSQMQIELANVKMETSQLESIEIDHLALRLQVPILSEVKKNKENPLDFCGFISLQNFTLKLDRYTTISTSGKIGINLPVGHEVDLKGKIAIGQNSADFILKGENTYTKEKEKEFKVDFSFIDEQLKNSKAHFAFLSQSEKDWSLNVKMDEIHADYLITLQKALDYYFPSVNQICITNGTLSLEALLNFHQHYLKSVQLDQLICKDTVFQVLDPKIDFSCDKLHVGLDYDFKEKKLRNWFLTGQALDLDFTDKKFGNFSLKKGEVNIQQQLDRFSLSTIKGDLENEPFEIALSGDKNHPNILLNLGLKSSLLEKKFGIKINESKEHLYRVFGKIQKEESNWVVEGKIEDLNYGYLAFSAYADQHEVIDFSKKEEIEKILLGIHGGKIQGENVNEGIYSAVLLALKMPWNLIGDIDVKGGFERGVLHLDLAFSDLSFLSDEIYFKQEKKNQQIKTVASLDYNCINEKLYLEAPLDGGICLHKESNLWFEDVIGNLQIIDTHLSINPLKAKSENLKMTGKLGLEFYEEFPFMLDIKVDEVVGKVVNLQRLARHFPEFQHVNIPFDGDLKAIEEGFCLKAILYPQPLLPTWTLKAHVINGESFDANLLALKDVSFDLNIDSTKSDMAIKDLVANVEINSFMLPYRICSPLISLNLQNDLQMDFSLSIESSFLEVANLKGVVKKNEDKIFVDLEPNPLIQHWKPFIKEKNEWKSGEVVLEITPMQISSILQRVLYQSKKDQFLGKIPNLDLSAFETTSLMIKANENHNLLFTLASKDKVYFDAMLSSEIFNISTVSIGNYFLNSVFKFDKQKLHIQDVNLSYQDYSLKIKEGHWDHIREKGFLKIDQLQFASLKKLIEIFPMLNPQLDCGVLIGGELEFTKDQMQFLANTLEITDHRIFSGIDLLKPVTILFDPNYKLKFLNVDMRLKGEVDHHDYFQIQSEEIEVDLEDESIASKQMKLMIAPELVKKIPLFLSNDIAMTLQEKVHEIQEWDNLIKLDVKFKIDAKKCHLNGKIQDGYYWIKNHSYFFKDVALNYENDLLNLLGSVSLFDHFLAFDASFDTKERSNILLNIENKTGDQEKAKAIFSISDDKVHLVNFYGKLFGTEFNFLPHHLQTKEEELIFTVSLDFDPREILSYLPKNMQTNLKGVKIGEKINLKGNLLLDSICPANSYFKGFITTKNIEIQDVIIQNIQTLVTYDLAMLKVENFSLADSAVLAKFDQMLVHFSEEKFLDFELKNFQINDFRPSLISKVNQPKTKIKPFLVRNLKMDDCKGNLKDLDKIKGKGTVQFINTFKRENHLIDIPIEIIARLGLDIGLLIPVRGEVDIEIANQKVWLKELKNSYSDGKRSHFFFPSGKKCYIDFDGNIHIDVRMKQYVLFKITQPFTLSMRGTFQKPSFSLK